MTDDEILAGLMRRIMQRGVTVTQYSDRGPTVRLDDQPFSVSSDEIQAMSRAIKGEVQ